MCKLERAHEEAFNLLRRVEEERLRLPVPSLLAQNRVVQLRVALRDTRRHLTGLPM